MLKFMTKEEFVATKHTPTDKEWSDLMREAAEGKLVLKDRENCILYAEGFLIEKREDGYYSHAWWYAANKNATLEEAEEDQYNWRNEFVDEEGN